MNDKFSVLQDVSKEELEWLYKLEKDPRVKECPLMGIHVVKEGLSFTHRGKILKRHHSTVISAMVSLPFNRIHRVLEF